MPLPFCSSPILPLAHHMPGSSELIKECSCRKYKNFSWWSYRQGMWETGPCILQSLWVREVYSVPTTELWGNKNGADRVWTRKVDWIVSGGRGFGGEQEYWHRLSRKAQFNSSGCAWHGTHVMLYDSIQFPSSLAGLPCQHSTLDNQSLHSPQGKRNCTLHNDGDFYGKKGPQQFPNQWLWQINAGNIKFQQGQSCFYLFDFFSITIDLLAHYLLI